jgi:hypothetical protein
VLLADYWGYAAAYGSLWSLHMVEWRVALVLRPAPTRSQASPWTAPDRMGGDISFGLLDSIAGAARHATEQLPKHAPATRTAGTISA